MGGEGARWGGGVVGRWGGTSQGADDRWGEERSWRARSGGGGAAERLSRRLARATPQHTLQLHHMLTTPRNPSHSPAPQPPKPPPPASPAPVPR